MGKEPTRKQLGSCQAEVKRRLAIHPPHIVPRNKNLQGMVELQMAMEDLVEMLDRLSALDYVEGPNYRRQSSFRPQTSG